MIKFFNSSLKKIIFPVVLFSFLGAAPYYVDAQTRHWKSVILPGHSWSYILPTNQTTADWIQLGYDDALWSVGNTGIGYGDGSYLELSNIDSDNSLPENWIANSNFQTLKVSIYNDNASLLIYPNPVMDKLYLSAINGEQIQSVEIISLNGQKMMSEQLNETRLQINTSKLASGIYFVRIKLKSKTMIKRIIKN